VNARLLWEAGTMYGYGTDTSFLPKDTLEERSWSTIASRRWRRA